MIDHEGPALRLDLADALELGEILGFLTDWLDGPDRGELAASRHRHTGGGFILSDLEADLTRLAALLGDVSDHPNRPTTPHIDNRMGSASSHELGPRGSRSRVP